MRLPLVAVFEKPYSPMSHSVISPSGKRHRPPKSLGPAPRAPERTRRAGADAIRQARGQGDGPAASHLKDATLRSEVTVERGPCTVRCDLHISPESRDARGAIGHRMSVLRLMYDYVLEREYRRARRLYITVYTTAVYYAAGLVAFSIN